jgi:enamine deaminase RidA (YjgF/YER057c/UK114 family)
MQLHAARYGKGGGAWCKIPSSPEPLKKSGMTIKRLQKSSRMSQAVIHGGIVYLAGQVGTEGAGATEQTQQALESIDRLLAAAGSGKSQLLQATIWLADMADFGAMNAVWEAWLDRENPPARSTGQTPMVSPGYKVEITVVAAVQS